MKTEKEFSFYERKALIAKMRYLSANSGNINGLTERAKKYVIGKGIPTVTTAEEISGNDEWDKMFGA